MPRGGESSSFVSLTPVDVSSTSRHKVRTDNHGPLICPETKRDPEPIDKTKLLPLFESEIQERRDYFVLY